MTYTAIWIILAFFIYQRSAEVSLKDKLDAQRAFIYRNSGLIDAIVAFHLQVNKHLTWSFATQNKQLCVIKNFVCCLWATRTST